HVGGARHRSPRGRQRPRRPARPARPRRAHPLRPGNGGPGVLLRLRRARSGPGDRALLPLHRRHRAARAHHAPAPLGRARARRAILALEGVLHAHRGHSVLSGGRRSSGRGGRESGPGRAGVPGHRCIDDGRGDLHRRPGRRRLPGVPKPGPMSGAAPAGSAGAADFPAPVPGYTTSSSARLCQIQDLNATRNFQPSVPRPGMGSMLSAAQMVERAPSEWRAAGAPEEPRRRRSALDAAASSETSPWRMAATVPVGNAHSHAAVTDTAYLAGESAPAPNGTASRPNASAVTQNTTKPNTTFDTGPPTAMKAVVV